ncbi:unnamed protein product [Ilex paraguariensis]|uniref:Pentatricopeptide repeat-containing protein n=1 Tax=Ilex paraguariensis TaxID=185542 RepID=A0ABC8TM98_9AQUA
MELDAHLNQSSFRHHLPLLNRLLIMYLSCGFIENAHQLFDRMPIKDLNSWAAMIFAYVDEEKYEEAIHLFIKMQHIYQYHCNEGILKFPVSWIVVCILQACVSTMNLEFGRQIHGWLMKAGYSNDLFLSSTLVSFYGKLGCLEGADFVFDQTSGRNTVVWTAYIANYCKEERFDEVIGVFKEMGREGVKKNSFTFSSVLKACGKLRDDGYCGRQVHANTIKLGVNLKSYVQCGLVDMYGKFGLVRDARRVFEMNGVKKNAACWNAMLNAYIQHGCCIEAVKLECQVFLC